MNNQLNRQNNLRRQVAPATKPASAAFLARHHHPVATAAIVLFACLLCLLQFPSLAAAPTPLTQHIPEEKESYVRVQPTEESRAKRRDSLWVNQIGSKNARKIQGERKGMLIYISKADALDTPAAAGTEYGYKVWLPNGYHSDPNRLWPVCFIPSWAQNQAINMGNHGAYSSGRIGYHLRRSGYIVVALQEGGHGHGEDVRAAAIIAVHDDVMKRFRVMENQKYATGLSRGANNADFMAAARDGFAGVFVQGVPLQPQLRPKDSSLVLSIGGNDAFFCDWGETPISYAPLNKENLTGAFSLTAYNNIPILPLHSRIKHEIAPIDMMEKGFIFMEANSMIKNKPSPEFRPIAQTWVRRHIKLIRRMPVLIERVQAFERTLKAAVAQGLENDAEVKAFQVEFQQWLRMPETKKEIHADNEFWKLYSDEVHPWCYSGDLVEAFGKFAEQHPGTAAADRAKMLSDFCKHFHSIGFKGSPEQLNSPFWTHKIMTDLTIEGKGEGEGKAWDLTREDRKKLGKASKAAFERLSKMSFAKAEKIQFLMSVRQDGAVAKEVQVGTKTVVKNYARLLNTIEVKKQDEKKGHYKIRTYLIAGDSPETVTDSSTERQKNETKKKSMSKEFSNCLVVEDYEKTNPTAEPKLKFRGVVARVDVKAKKVLAKQISAIPTANEIELDFLRKTVKSNFVFIGQSYRRNPKLTATPISDANLYSYFMDKIFVSMLRSEHEHIEADSPNRIHRDLLQNWAVDLMAETPSSSGTSYAEVGYAYKLGKGSEKGFTEIVEYRAKEKGTKGDVLRLLVWEEYERANATAQPRLTKRGLIYKLDMQAGKVFIRPMDTKAQRALIENEALIRLGKSSSTGIPIESKDLHKLLYERLETQLSSTKIPGTKTNITVPLKQKFKKLYNITLIEEKK